MHRPGSLVLPATLATLLAVAPVASGLAMAADPVVTVKRGDTLTHIAKRHGVPVATIVTLNDLENPNRIFPGQRLRLADAAPAPAAAPATAAARVHVVVAGEHLTRIAKRYGVTIAAIVAANRIADPSRIYAGQRLTIPGAAAPQAPAPAAAPATAAARVHVVAAGEHLTRIAKRYDVTIAAIVAANRIADPSRIYAGQRLTIPVAAAATPPGKAVPAPASMPASMAALVARRSDVGALVAVEARRFGVPVAFAQAVAWQESGWQQGVVSRAGAVGIMQLMPATAEWVGGAMLGERVIIDDARHNVRAGVRLLAHYLERYEGNRDLVLAAYYQGQTAVDRHGVYPVSRPYIASIRTLERLFES